MPRYVAVFPYLPGLPYTAMISGGIFSPRIWFASSGICIRPLKKLGRPSFWRPRLIACPAWRLGNRSAWPYPNMRHHSLIDCRFLPVPKVPSWVPLVHASLRWAVDITALRIGCCRMGLGAFFAQPPLLSSLKHHDITTELSTTKCSIIYLLPSAIMS